jgi:hypothetical protein
VGTSVAPAAPAAAAPPGGGGAQPPEYYEWTDASGQKQKAKYTALTAALQREQVTNKKWDTFQKESAELAAERQRQEAANKALLEGRFNESALKDLPRMKRIELLARALESDMDQEKSRPDIPPHLQERLKQGDDAISKLTQFEQQQEELKNNELKSAARERWANTFGGALKEVGVPTNEITLSMMARDYQEAKSQGWEPTPAQLAASTRELVHGMFDSFAGRALAVDDRTGEEKFDEESCLALLETFPKFARVIHKGLLLRSGRRAPPQVQQLQPRTTEKKEAEPTNKPKLFNSVDEAKAYGVTGLRTI